MILSGREIEREVKAGNIVIDPFDAKQVNPNSYNLRLESTLLTYDCRTLDADTPNLTSSHNLPPEGLVLYPGILYLGSTVEKAGSDKYVPLIEGRSSIGRLGVSVHVTAGFGDIGFLGRWTLEITCVHEVWVFPKMEICQVCFHEIKGDYDLYNGKYQNAEFVEESKLHEEFDYDYDLLRYVPK